MRKKKLDAGGRYLLRQQRSKPLAENLRKWLVRQRREVEDGTATAKAFDYSINRWAALTRYLEDGDLPIDNNSRRRAVRGTALVRAYREADASGSELQLPARYGQNDCAMAIGRPNWMFAGSLRAGRRAANIMTLVQSVKLNGHDPYLYLKDVLERLPTQPASRIAELLPHRWQSTP